MNTRTCLVALAATLPILVATGTSTFGQDVTLQYHWNKGEEIRHRFLQQSTTTAGLPDGSSAVAKTNMSQVIRTTVEDVAADGTATLRYVYESARWETRTPAGTIVVDTASTDPSSASAPGKMKEILSALVGATFVIVTAPNGHVQKVEGMDRVMEKMFESFGTDPSTASLLATLKSNFNEDGIRDALTQGSSEFPDRPLKPGDTWDRSATATYPLFGRQTMTTQFTLKDVETRSGSRVARIATRVTTQSTEPPAGLAGLKVQLTDNTDEGELIFDVTNGRMLSSVTRMTMSMEMSMPGPDGNAINLRGQSNSSMSVEVLQP